MIAGSFPARAVALAVVAVSSFVSGAAGLKTAYDDDGTVTVNGKRTFIIGSYMVGNRYTAPKPTLELYQELSKAGFNLVNAGGADMDLAQQAGLMTWTAVGTIDLKDPEGTGKALAEKVAAVKSHPSLAFLETSDEPAWSWMKPETRIPAEAFAKSYPIIKGVDAEHLLYTNHAPTNLISTLQAYNAGTDIVAVDIYPVNPGGMKTQYALFEDGYQGDLNDTYISQVGKYCDKMRKVAGPNRPVFMVLQAFAWEMLADAAERHQEKILYPTREQTRFMAWQSIIHGANGIVYWGSSYTPQPSDCWSGILATAREVADLGDALAERAQTPALAFTYQELGRSVDQGVKWIAKEHGGKLFLFTCNEDKNPCKAAVSGLAGWRKCRVLGEDRDVAIADGTFVEDWARFGVHLYELSK